MWITEDTKPDTFCYTPLWNFYTNISSPYFMMIHSKPIFSTSLLNISSSAGFSFLIHNASQLKDIKGSSLAISLFIFPLDSFNRSTHCKNTRGRFVCHILRIYIYLIESPVTVKRISLFQFFYISILIRQKILKSFFL